jgi:GPH family glycoside/pentoside/hexuronide:cation symporter
LGVLSADGKERTALSSYRMVFAFGGSLFALWIIEPLVKIFSNDMNDAANLQHGWFYAMMIFSLIVVLLFLGCFLLTKERVVPIPEQESSLRKDLKNLFANKPWWILLGAGVAALIFNSIRDGGAVYYFKYYVSSASAQNLKLGSWTISLSLTTIYLVLGQAFNIVGVILATPLSNRFGKKNTYLFCMAMAAVLSVLFYFLGKKDVMLIMIFQCVISVCAGGIFPLLWAMYADICDYSEWKTGRRATGLIFSSSSMSQKFGWTIGGATTGWLLGYFGFQANTVQGDSAQQGIVLMLSLLPAIGASLSVIFIAIYPLTEKTTLRITKELTLKRKQPIEYENAI